MPAPRSLLGPQPKPMHHTPLMGRDAVLSNYTPTLAEKLTDFMARNWYGDSREGTRKAEKAINVLNFTPVGAATGMYDAGRAAGKGDYVTGGLMGAMAMFPGFHGSPVKTLRKVSATPQKRQFDNATSQFGGFFAPHVQGAKKYAGDNGQIYKASVEFDNPYEMEWSEFSRWQNISKTASGKRIDPEKWAIRSDALKAASPEFVTGLKAMGHDGIIVKGRDGNIIEMASFKDVPVQPHRQALRAYHGSGG